MWPLNHRIPVTHLKTSNQYALLMDMAPMYGTIDGIIIEVVYIFDPLMAQCLQVFPVWTYDTTTIRKLDNIYVLGLQKV
jgi:hypothetical protein